MSLGTEQWPTKKHPRHPVGPAHHYIHVDRDRGIAWAWSWPNTINHNENQTSNYSTNI